MTKDNLIKQNKFLNDQVYDTAVPVEWVDRVWHIIGMNPVPHFVWLYDEQARIFGRPYPIDMKGWIIQALLKKKND